ncbi:MULTISPECIES: NAD(P)-binding protein [Alkalimonas]|uniref:NAD(P)-binding protein n=2 Tax=Alkalimonas TaxID=265980 RepID=A0ABU7J4D5_9GAMM|nr:MULTISPECIES: NAD(P)-binding protein [unclassified Alkalimonas]MEE2001203.1 NAD(P)-binding protein [Alkalimonas sp. MEB108]MEE2025816.1 NAD(P)-binding protein [Alkalimonas sp. MEB004]
MKDLDYLIVGAGISGLTAALTILSYKPGSTVVLVDSGTEPGGLLRSETFAGQQFDLGTHIPEMTSDEDLNKLLFPQQICRSWHQLTALKVGNYFNGMLNERSQFPDISSQGEIAKTVLAELLQTSDRTSVAGDLKHYAEHCYGSTISNQVLAPLMAKFCNKALAELSPQALKYYGLSRLICGDRQQSINLKKINHLDAVLAYSDDREKPRDSRWYYPDQQQGIGQWIKLLQQQITQQGGQCLFSSRIQKVERQQSMHQVSFHDGKVLQARQVIWTVPVYLGLQGVQQQRPESRAISIFHFHSTETPLAKCHYLYCYEPALQSYRITLYNNLQGSEATASNRCSVEVIHDVGAQPAADCIAKELKAMGVFADRATMHHLGTSEIKAGFPIPLAGSEEQRLQLFEGVKTANPSIEFIGRAKPALFFMTDVLMDAYQAAKQLVTKGVADEKNEH